MAQQNRLLYVSPKVPDHRYAIHHYVTDIVYISK